VTRAVAEPHSGSSSPNDDETDETEDDDDEASFDDDDYDDEDGGMGGDDTFVKMSQTELIMMTPEQRKEYHRRSVLEGQIRARNKRERQKVRTRPSDDGPVQREPPTLTFARHFLPSCRSLPRD
jgi:hypothetical protein